MADRLDLAEDNLQQYLRQQQLGQARVRKIADLPGAIDYRQQQIADVLNIESGPPLARQAAAQVIGKNTDDMIDYYNFLQFEQDPNNLLERRAIDEAVYTGRVPFGYEDSDYLYQQGRYGIIGNALQPEVAEQAGVPRDILVAGNAATSSQVPIHEGIHPIITLPKKEEENAIRALDYFRMQRYGNAGQAQEILSEAGFDVTTPEGLGRARVLALKGAMSMTDDQFQDLSDVDKAELQESFDAYKKAPGLISSALGSLTGEEPQPEFDNILVTPENAAEMSEEDFNTLLKAAPAFTFEKAFSRSIDITGPRMIGEGDSAVRAYENGGGVGYFERQEAEYGVEPSQFEQDVTQQPGREYFDILPRSRPESVQHPVYGEMEEPSEFDPAGGIMGMAGRALSTFDRKLSGLPVSDEQLAGAAMDIVPTSAGIASAAFGPALSPGMLGMFITKHGSPFDFNVFRRPTKEDVGLTSTRANLGPAIYSGEEPVATAFAQKFARRKAAGEEDESYDVATLFGDPEDQVARPQMYDLSNPDAEEGLSLVLQDASARANTHVPDLAGQRSFYFFDDGSALIHNYDPNPGTPRILPLDKGEAFVYTAKVSAEKDQYLDWSAPFFKQSEFVRNTLRPFLKKYGIDDRSTGQQMWNTIAEANNGDAMTANAILEQAGIKGNKVVQSGNEILATFNPDDMSIVDKQELGKVLGYADGGVVSLKDKAVNMNRGPRSNGIMQYVPYITGATNGY